MADNPLVKFWNDTLTQANADKKNADTQLKATQDDLKAKRDALAVAAAKLKSVQQRISDIRAKLAAIPTSDDGQALLDQFRQATLDVHKAQGGLLAAEDAVAQSASAAAKTAALVSSASTRVANASAALSEAKQQATARDALKDAAGRPPVTKLKADAAKAVASPPLTTAKKRIAGDFPEPLRTQAHARADAEQARVTRAQTDLSVAEDLAADAADKIQKQRLVLARAVQVLQDTVQNGPKGLAQTASTLGKVADSNQAKLTPDEISSIQVLKKDGTTDNAIVKSREEAATAAASLAAKQQIFDDQQAVLDNARFKARAQGVDELKLDDDPDVKKAIDDLKKPKTERDKADTDFGADKRKTMSEWAATVPDANWQLLADFENATSLLNTLSATDPAALVTAVTAAENALVAALQEAAKGPLLLDLVRQETARRSSLRDAGADAFTRRAFSAMRCDF